jgi:hypothetical protein
MISDWLHHPEEIQLLDPLGLDKGIEKLHALNRAADTAELVRMLYRHLPVPDQLDTFSYSESIAAMRDLGIFIGILKRHKIEPVEAVPELEYVLLVLMVKTGLPPRDTLIHYTVWNPTGARMRTYTGLEDEKFLIESIRVAYPSLLEACAAMDKLYELPLDSHEFEFQANVIREQLEGMVQGVVLAKRKVSPGVFANELRFYYDPIKVDYNKEYLGPGAVEMPMFVVDHLLWSSDCPDATYSEFKEGYLPYNLPAIRQIYHRYTGRPSLVARVEDALRKNPCKENLRAAIALSGILTILKSFRMPHKKLAESAYAHSEEHHRQQGSGGYSVDILEHIINLQHEKTAPLLALTQEVRKKVVFV